jgi:hypothetical protein
MGLGMAQFQKKRVTMNQSSNYSSSIISYNTLPNLNTFPKSKQQVKIIKLSHNHNENPQAASGGNKSAIMMGVRSFRYTKHKSDKQTIWIQERTSIKL